ncbi:MAG: tetratricopeptide repeat protein [Bryobacteraceae bacterium]
MRLPVLPALAAAMLTAQPPSPEQIFREAVEAQQRGDDRLAIQKYQELLKLAPKVPEVHANLGAAYARLGQFENAVRHYRAALALDPNNQALQFNLALAHYKQQNFREASKLLEALSAALPADLRVALLLADCYNRTGQEAKTVALLGRLEPSHPNDLALKWLLGAALVRTGKKQEGLVRLDGPARQGNSAEVCLLAGQTAMEIHEYELGRDYAEMALKLNPKLPGVWTLAGMTRHYLADNDGAVEAFQRALAADPDDFEAHLGLGTVLIVKRELEQARQHLEKALQLRPADKLAHYQMGRLERAAGNVEAAVKHLEFVVKADPEWAQPHIELSALYFRLNRPEDGERERSIFDKLNAKGQQ